MKKKIICALLSALLVVSLLTGCGEGDASSSDIQSGDTSQSEHAGKEPTRNPEYDTRMQSPFLDQSYLSDKNPLVSDMSWESYYIQVAPAYDTADAASYISDMPSVRSLIDTANDSAGLNCFGASRPSDVSLQALQSEIDKLSADNHKVSLIMVDLSTKSGVGYCSDIPMCTQSTVKSVYVGSLIRDNPQALADNGQLMHDAIVFSSNPAYDKLRELYGSDCLVKWCEEVGVDPGFATERNYPRSYNARDMLKLWTRLYCFFNSGEDVSNFGAYYADTSCSATKKQLGDRYPVQTKAGWESGVYEDQNYSSANIVTDEYTDGNPENNECAINDTGVVYTLQGPYLFVIYTNLPFGVYKDYVTENPLYDLTEALFNVQQSLHE